MKAKLILLVLLIGFWLIVAGADSLIHMPILSISAVILTLLITLRFALLPENIKINGSWPQYVFWLFKEIFSSAMDVVKHAWGGDEPIDPEMRWIKTKLKSEEAMVIYANSITLTPGTVTVEIEQGSLLVHALNKSYLKDLERHSMDNHIAKIIK